MIPPVAAFAAPDALACAAGETMDHRGADGAVAGAFEQRLRAVGIDLGLIADDLEAGDALRKRRVVQVGHACLYGVVEALQAQFRFGRSPLQFGDVLASTFGLILAAAEDAAEQHFKPVGIKQAVLNMADHHVVQLVHGDRAALAARLALPGLDRAGIVAVAAALASADGHGPTAIAAIADAGQ
ncbi:hypothetical protein [Nitratireductor aquibiodomus]|uniref:hypothetical protein n=1 Tax=Nitratireductor aquibiodomus TaxID=204799 RepID=UPI000467EF7C|nr:hypothetical protein [Nitratireductor aquibiodomus]